jgi:tRNA A37 methylthiotransferase MiaB
MDGIVTISPKQMRKFDELFDARVPIATVRGNVIDKALLRHDGRHIGVGVNACGYPDDFHIQISQGCVNACSYCAIKKAKGSVTSKPPEDVLEEFRDGVSRGYGRFVLLADDCGSYGLDINTDLAELLNELDAEAETSLFDIHYIEPGRLVELHPRVARSAWRRLYFMNAPLQSTSSRILAAMNRHYDVEDVLSIVRQIKTIHPEIQLETHILYGFPGETRRDLEDTFRLAGDFDRVIYFCYTVRPNTRAARFRRGISETEKLRRARMIIEAARDRPHLKLGYSAQLIEGLMKDRGPRGA